MQEQNNQILVDLFENQKALLSNRAKNFIKNRFDTMESFMEIMSKTSKILSLPKCGKQTYGELKDLHIKLIQYAAKDDQHLGAHNKKVQLKTISLSYHTDKYFRETIDSIYNKILATQDNYCKRRIEKYLSNAYELLIFDISEAKPLISPTLHQYAMRDINELQAQFLMMFEQHLHYHMLLDDFLQLLANEGISLPPQEKEFTLKFYERKKYLPLFFLTSHKLKTSSNTSHLIIREWYMTNNADTKEISELKVKYNLTNARIRQIVSSLQVNLLSQSFIDNNIGFYTFLSLPYISKFNFNYKRLLMEENAEISFHVFLILTTLINKYKIFAFTKQGNVIIPVNHSAIKNDEVSYICTCSSNLSFFNFKKTLFDICRQYNEINSKVNIDITQYIMSEQYWVDYTVHPYDGLCNLISEICSELFNYDITDGIIHKEPKTISLSILCQDILKNSQYPLTLQDIQKQIRLKYPSLEIDEKSILSKIRYALSDRTIFQSLGKRSTYALIGKHSYIQGSLKDALISILISAKKPLNTAEIKFCCSQNGIYSSHRSITTTLGELINENIVIKVQRGIYKLNDQRKLK